MRPFLVAIAIASLIGLLVAHPPRIPWMFWPSGEFLMTGLPAWLQGLGTVAAAIIAWSALTTWQGQDKWRRKAAFAEQLLGKVHAASSSIHHARYHHTFYASSGPTDQDIKAIGLDPARAGRIEQCVTACNELRTQSLITKHYFGDAAEIELLALAQFAGQLHDAYGALSRVAHAGVPISDSTKRMAWVCCATLGLHFIEGHPGDFGPHDEDEFEKNVFAVTRRLEEKLVPYLA